MSRDEVFLKPGSGPGDFEFNDEVAEVFDDMVVRSVPFNLEQQQPIAETSKRFWLEGTNVYDLGCSTATGLINLCRQIDRCARFVGYVNSVPMLERARSKETGSGWVMTGSLRSNVAQALPAGVWQWLRAQQRKLRLQWRPSGVVRFGDFRRLKPLSRIFGFDRGQPIAGAAICGNPSARDVAVHAYGNVLAAVAFLHGIAAEELTEEELNHPDPDYEVILAVRAVKPG